MTSAPYRPKCLQRNNVFMPSPSDKSPVELDIADDASFPSLSESTLKSNHTWNSKGKLGKTSGSVIATNWTPPFVNPGWLYIDGFDRKDGVPMTIYGGPNAQLRTDTDRCEKDMGRRHRKHKREMEELNEVLGDISPLGLQLREMEREEWLVNDVIEELRGYNSDDSENSDNIDPSSETGDDW